MDFLSRSRLQLQNRTCKPGAIFSAICRRDIAGVSSMLGTLCNFGATKIASSCRDKNRLCKRALSKECKCYIEMKPLESQKSESGIIQAKERKTTKNSR